MGTAVPSPPRMLGRYALYEQIASGGMATVHIGRLLGPVGFARTVAIKRMRPQFTEDPEFVAMFLDEARVAARIRHPNVVPTLDVVTIEGELFLVMEYVQGESLARLIKLAYGRGERIPPPMVATIMVGVLHGLHAAHEAKNDRGEPLGIVHRDVTPQNVLVGTDGVSRVLDFGVAKAAGRVQTTREGQLKGKIPYMAPEQIRGNATRVSDVYAASVVLWEALAGRRLFKGDSEAEVFANVIEGTKVPPSEHAPGLPPELDAVTMRGLAMDPAQRFATAREMARALENSAPLVAASVIGEWVEAVAKEALEERSARVAAIETDSSVEALPMPAPAPSGRVLDPSAPSASVNARAALPAGLASDGVSVVIADDTALATQLSSGSVSAPGRVSIAAAIHRPPLRVAIAAGVAGVALLGVLALWPRHSAPQATGIVPADSSAPPGASEAPLPPPAPAPAVASAASAPATAAGSVSVPPPRADSAPTPPAAARAPARPPPAAPPRAPAASSASCHPPFYVDSRGVRVFKPECL
jgi:serine/threonine protein kinase